MPILSDDIKLLKSAVMADVPEGGGAMTGNEVLDGLSNNLFPDTSTDDRAAGRVNFRKVFGVAHTNDTDTLLGASFAVLAPPADPLVHVTLFETPGWADERDTARELVERYLVKGPRFASRILDTHYTGSLLLQMYQVGGTNFPAAGDAIVLRNPNGQEQYVRVIKVTVSSPTFNVSEGGNVVSVGTNVAVCELGQPLAFDVLGPPVARVINEGNNYAVPFSTSVAAGVAFYGVKPLDQPAAIGDRSVFADGGIYSPIVPAATVEQPLIDLQPLTRRQSLSPTAVAALTLPAQSINLQPGVVLALPVPVQPGSLTITRDGTVFNDNGDGSLLQGTTVVGLVDYRGRTITMEAGSPSYGTVSTVVAYLPATPVGASTHSTSTTVTTANQGQAFTAAFEPVPAPGTFTLSYMAQGRWYDLLDNGNGKLAGADPSYGTGTINYSSGSVAFTLGAIPDVGSEILYSWGDKSSAIAVPPGDLPAQLEGVIQLDPRLRPETLVLSWTTGGTPRTATCNAEGVISGHATGTCTGGRVVFSPGSAPGTVVSCAYTRAAAQQSGGASFTNNGGGSYTAAVTPVVPGTLRMTVLPTPVADADLPVSIDVYDNGAGVLLSRTEGITGALGTVDYATGAIALSPTVSARVWRRQAVSRNVGSVGGSRVTVFTERQLYPVSVIGLINGTAVVNGFGSGVDTAETELRTPSWGAQVKTLAGLSMSISGLAFVQGGQVYTAQGGVLQAGWNLITGVGAAAGSVSSSGAVNLTTAPPGGQSGAITWINAAQDTAGNDVGQGVFRVETAPIKTGVFQIQSGALVGSSNNAGVISGGGWSGTVDFARGIVNWNRLGGLTGAPASYAEWQALNPVAADTLTYNAVFLQYLPLDGSLLGLETARLPLDGRVPIYRPGGQVIVHNTLTTTLPSIPVRGQAYSLGRQRIAAVTVRSASGVRVPGDRYTVQFNDGTITIPAGANLVGIDQPMTVHHRIEDELMVLRADISGRLDLVAGLTHNYPAGTSFVSSKLRKGDLFARTFGYRERSTWANSWQATADATAQPTASFNETNFPITVTNRGAIAERWAVIFTAATVVRVVGEETGQVLTGVSITGTIEAINPETNAPYFSINPLGWGGGWAVGNVLLFETAACGAPTWVARTVLQGPPTVASDSAVIAFRADVDA